MEVHLGDSVTDVLKWPPSASQVHSERRGRIATAYSHCVGANLTAP